MNTSRIATIAFAIAAATQLGATDCGNVLRDPGFDLWCGSALCAWTVERGQIQRVATWNAGDPGVELVGDDVAIQQLTPLADSDGNCLEFDLVADIDPSADVELGIDLAADGTLEYQERLPSASWQALSYQVALTPPFAGVRFELAKTGSGRAVLANIGAKVVTCSGLTPLDPRPLPLGEPCIDGHDCASGICGATYTEAPRIDTNLFDLGVCVGCDATHACGAGEVCGLADPTSPVRGIPVACVATAARALGERCHADAECASAICTNGTCSTCRDGSQCAVGEGCSALPGPPADLSGALTGAWISECAPSHHARAHGEPCASNDDCASSACAGVLHSECDDGRACATAADCPFEETGLGTTPLSNGPCTLVGIQGGTCQ